MEILLVEDSLADARLSQEALQGGRVSNHVSVVRDGEEAMAYLHQEGSYWNVRRPDLILLALDLPRMDGRQVLAEVEADPPAGAHPGGGAHHLGRGGRHREGLRPEGQLPANVTKPVNLARFLEAVGAIQEFWLAVVRLPSNQQGLRPPGLRPADAACGGARGTPLLPLHRSRPLACCRASLWGRARPRVSPDPFDHPQSIPNSQGGYDVEERLIALDQVPDTGTVAADLFGRKVIVTKVDGRPRVYVDSCPHFGGPLHREGDKLVCGWHMAAFALDGRCLRGPARAESRAIVLPTRVIDGIVTYVYTAPEGTPGAHEDDTHLAARLVGTDS